MEGRLAQPSRCARGLIPGGARGPASGVYQPQVDNTQAVKRGQARCLIMGNCHTLWPEIVVSFTLGGLTEPYVWYEHGNQACHRGPPSLSLPGRVTKMSRNPPR